MGLPRPSGGLTLALITINSNNFHLQIDFLKLFIL